MTDSADPLAAWCDREYPRHRAELFDFLRFPSVSAVPAHRADVAACATWLAAQLDRIGLATQVLATAGHPVVLGEWRGAGPAAPTYLVYGHYDVQPPDPVAAWTSPPFEPAVRDGRLYARGSVDDKGQLWLHVKALEAHLAVHGRLPCNVVVLAEGEEEVGSAHLRPLLAAERPRLACDGVVISDSAMFAPGVPSLVSSLRGIACFEVRVRGAATDLHSGMYGGAVANPAMALARLLATLHDDEGRVAVAGFYDDVAPVPEPIRAGLATLPHDDDAWRRAIDAPALVGERGYGTLERLWHRPTCEVNGLLSGWTGAGAKTVLPAEAMAKVSFRLVPDQDPARVEGLFRAHVARMAPPGVRVTVEALHGGKPWRGAGDGPLFEAARDALAAEFGRTPVIVGEGGSIPIVNDFAEILQVPVVLVGFGLPGENAHAPDEWISEENFRRGIRAMARMWARVRGA